MKLSLLLSILFSTAVVANQSQDVFIIVPGTWSAKSTWHRPGGDFYEALKDSAQIINADVITFTWSGKNSHKARVLAARNLATIIDQYDAVHLVTHSHGSNVGILASQFLERSPNTKKIKNFFAFATPVLIGEYEPNMDVIQHFFNFFSLADKVQSALGIFQRTFHPHTRIANLRLTINGSAPGHSSIHHPVVAQWLPHFADYLLHEEFFHQPGLLHFSTGNRPLYHIDHDQESLVELEQETFNLNFSLRNKKKRSHEKNNT